MLLVLGLLLGLSGCLGSGSGSGSTVASGDPVAGPAVSSDAASRSVAGGVVPSTLPSLASGGAPEAAPTVARAPIVATAVVTTSTAVPHGLATPEAASKNLWDAWRDDDRPRALVAASSVAVDALFRETWGAEIHNQGCATLSTNTYRCAFVDESTARIVTVVGGTTLGYRAIRVDPMPAAALATLVPITAAPPGSTTLDESTIPGDATAATGSSSTALGSATVGSASALRPMPYTWWTASPPGIRVRR